MRYLERLKRQCERALEAKPNRTFEFKEESGLAGIGNAIYVIEEVGGDPAVTFAKYEAYREAQRGKDKKERRACAALNSVSRTMYVGSSTTGIRKRIREHLGDGHRGTYALQLKHWFEGKYKITIRDYGDLEPELIQLLEDDLSHALKPAFGKRGGNGR